MTNLRDHTLAWLDSIGADGLMWEDGASFYSKEKIAECGALMVAKVPAFRHADGSYHAEPENRYKKSALTIIRDGGCFNVNCGDCPNICDDVECGETHSNPEMVEAAKLWIKHKEATK